MTAGTRRFPWDWYDGTVPDNVQIDDTAYVETAFSFSLCRSEQPGGVTIGRGSSVYLGTMFDVGSRGSVRLGEFALVHGARIICDAEVVLEDYVLVSWNVVLMDSYRVPADAQARRQELIRAASRQPRRIEGDVEARPIRIERGAWIGFDACILPGVTVGAGSIVGARATVTQDVPPYTIVAGNPAQVVRRIEARE